MPETLEKTTRNTNNYKPINARRITNCRACFLVSRFFALFTFLIARRCARIFRFSHFSVFSCFSRAVGAWWLRSFFALLDLSFFVMVSHFSRPLDFRCNLCIFHVFRVFRYGCVATRFSLFAFFCFSRLLAPPPPVTRTPWWNSAASCG